MYMAPAEIIYLQAMVILLMAYTTYAMYRDKLWSLFVLSILITVMSMMFIYGLKYQTHGELVILVMALGWAWYKSNPVCYNPFKCEKYDLELNK